MITIFLVNEEKRSINKTSDIKVDEPRTKSKHKKLNAHRNTIAIGLTYSDL